MNIKNDKAWINKTIKLEESIGIPNIANETKEQKKQKINTAINHQFHQSLTASRCDKSKVQFLQKNSDGWKAGTRKTYLNELINRIEAIILFKARTRMMHVKK